jgi:hypothetical protein
MSYIYTETYPELRRCLSAMLQVPSIANLGAAMLKLLDEGNVRRIMHPRYGQCYTLMGANLTEVKLRARTIQDITDACLLELCGEGKVFFCPDLEICDLTWIIADYLDNSGCQ